MDAYALVDYYNLPGRFSAAELALLSIRSIALSDQRIQIAARSRSDCMEVGMTSQVFQTTGRISSRRFRRTFRGLYEFPLAVLVILIAR